MRSCPETGPVALIRQPLGSGQTPQPPRQPLAAQRRGAWCRFQNESFQRPPSSPAPPLSFRPYRLAGARGPLWRGWSEVSLRPKTLELLWNLADARSAKWSTKTTSWPAVWSKRIVSPGTLAVSIAELRRALGDDARAPRFIQTVHRRGYRFVAPVYALVGTDAARPPGAPRSCSGREAELQRISRPLYQRALRAAGGCSRDR